MNTTLQSSLTCARDLDPSQPNTFQANRELGRPLTDSETKVAMTELLDLSFTKKFPRGEKFYADPNIPYEQTISLVSFTPSSEAVPDKDGVYGMIKVRGVFATDEDAIQRAEYLIKNVDSYNSIYQCYTGRPYPLSRSKNFIKDTHEVEIKKKVVDDTSKDIRKQRDEEAKIMKEIEQGQAELLKDTAADKKEDLAEVYTEQRVKYAQLLWVYKETQGKMREMQNSMISAKNKILELERESGEYRKTYMERYMKSRERAGLPSDDKSFLAYMGHDIEAQYDFLPKDDPVVEEDSKEEEPTIEATVDVVEPTVEAVSEAIVSEAIVEAVVEAVSEQEPIVEILL